MTGHRSRRFLETMAKGQQDGIHKYSVLSEMMSGPIFFLEPLAIGNMS